MTNEPERDDAQTQSEYEIYLQAFLDESDEDLESLMQVLLRLEDNPHDEESLNEAFRLLHTHKGSTGLMGFESISELAHELENRFDQFRSGTAVLNRDRITVLLRCVDFLRKFNEELRAGRQPDEDSSQILQQLVEVEKAADDDPKSAAEAPAAELPTALQSLQGGYRVRIEFEEGLQLADMKARLIVARLSNVGQIVATEPSIEDVESFDDLSHFVLIVLTDQDPGQVRRIAEVDGVKSVQIEGDDASRDTAKSEPTVPPAPLAPLAPPAPPDPAPTPAVKEPLAAAAPSRAETDSDVASVEADPLPAALPNTAGPKSSERQTDRAVAAETVRVGIDRLDKLMNLTGELVVTRERIVQITGEMNSVFRGTVSQRGSDVAERFRVGLEKVKEMLAARVGEGNGWHELLDELRDDVDVMETQFAAWQEGRRQFARIAESVDQLSRVSGNLQQSVLDTRMVPVAPLFNRFRRVIRDLAGERNKQVQLVIHGEKTELDKRMIDELGDPLLHLVRNSLDHGIESSDERQRLGKPVTGTIVLEASHSGNNVFITIRDDGAGLNVDRIRRRIVERGLASDTLAAEMTDQQIIEHIWHPGFSTADQITEISGRGVGMDVVKSRITELNGSIEVESNAGEGTSFKLRLPLTLAIIRCLLVRFRAGFFSMPIDDVREIVAVQHEQIHSVHGNETIDVRDEFIPLIRMDRVLYWHEVDYHRGLQRRDQGAADTVNVVILTSASRTIGLCVDELFGSADIVIKSLSDNFVNIRGLSGASIMGDGTVCLMLDVSEVIRMATERSGGQRPALET